MPEPASPRSAAPADLSSVWQMNTICALSAIVGEAARRRLPAVAWTIIPIGSTLSARVIDNVSAGDHEAGTFQHDSKATATRRREVFGEYLELLRDLQQMSVDRYGPTPRGLTTELREWKEAQYGCGLDIGVTLESAYLSESRSVGSSYFLHRLTVRASLATDPVIGDISDPEDSHPESL